MSLIYDTNPNLNTATENVRVLPPGYYSSVNTQPALPPVDRSSKPVYLSSSVPVIVDEGLYGRLGAPGARHPVLARGGRKTKPRKTKHSNTKHRNTKRRNPKHRRSTHRRK